ncbi:MAG: tetratricopeptide repeat protein [Tannerellaceae bacterium]|jgi:signal transduction histidine kinase|nr:tetratricopeptide repeat protein [Tannerellaceae bacterium]
MKRTLALCLCLSVLPALNVNGQSLHADSLENVLNTQKLSDEEQFDIFKKLCMMYKDSNIEKLHCYAKKTLEYSLKSNDKKAIGASYSLIGEAYHSKGISDSALIYYSKALDVTLEINDKHNEISVYINIGGLLSEQGDMVGSLEYYQKALSVAENTNDIQQQIRILSNMGTLYNRMDHTSYALQYYERIKILAEKADFPDGKCIAYFNLGNIYQKQGELDKALEYELKALDISRSIGYKTFEVMSIVIIAQIYYSDKFKEYDEAEKYAIEALEMASEFGDTQVLLNVYTLLSEVYRLQKRYENCDMAASKAWEMDTTDLSIRRDVAANVAFANIYLGNKDKAALFLERLNDLSKKVNDQGIHSALANMEVKYETEKKAMRIASLEKERQLYVWLGVAGGLLVFALLIVLWLTLRNARKERLLIATRSVLDGEMKERTRLAHDLHDRLSGNLSAVKIELGHQAESLQNVRDKLDKCIREVRETAHDIMPASLQFGLKVALEDFTAQFPAARFHFFGKENPLEKRIAFVAYCCASELVTNAIRHSGASKINVQMVQGEKHIGLTVQDDGCGFDEKAVTLGVGLQSIRDRVASCQGKMEVFSSPGKGTEIIIEISV